MSRMPIASLLGSYLQLSIQCDSASVSRPSLFLVLNSNNNLSVENAQELL